MSERNELQVFEGFQEEFQVAQTRIKENDDGCLFLGDLKSLDKLPSIISDNRKIVEIDINNTNFVDISPLAEVTWLRGLRLSNTPVEDISFIGNLKLLIPESPSDKSRGIYFANTKIQDPNVQDISKIEDIKIRTEALINYYSDSNDNIDPIDFDIITNLPKNEPGISFAPTSDYTFDIARRSAQITPEEQRTLGDLPNVLLSSCDELDLPRFGSVSLNWN